MQKIPFFSILIPTRNRPKMLKLSLASLLNQTFPDYEIIISDNSDPENQKQNRQHIEKINSAKIRYVTPANPLNMHDNWEFGFNFAEGGYQGVLIDKTLLKANALEELYAILKDRPVDIINFLHSGVHYYPNRLFKFRCSIKQEAKNDVEPFFPSEELTRRVNFAKNIRTGSVDECKFYNFGKVCFGFYSKKLVEKIKAKYQRVFHAISCDYNSCALALECAENGLLYNKELLLAICNFVGNGRKGETEPGALLEFLKTCDPQLSFFEDLPIPHLYTALHNLCAYDYSLARSEKHPINYPNLIKRCAEDLATFPFSSEKEREDQYNILTSFSKELAVNVNRVESVKCERKLETFSQKLYRFLFKKNFWAKIGTIRSRIVSDLRYRSLKSLLRE